MKLNIFDPPGVTLNRRKIKEPTFWKMMIYISIISLGCIWLKNHRTLNTVTQIQLQEKLPPTNSRGIAYSVISYLQEHTNNPQNIKYLGVTPIKKEGRNIYIQVVKFKLKNSFWEAGTLTYQFEMTGGTNSSILEVLSID